MTTPDIPAIIAGLSAADVAEWHERSAEGYAKLNAEHLERWPDEGDVPRYLSSRKFHLEAAAAAVRSALIERAAK